MSGTNQDRTVRTAPLLREARRIPLYRFAFGGPPKNVPLEVWRECLELRTAARVSLALLLAILVFMLGAAGFAWSWLLTKPVIGLASSCVAIAAALITRRMQRRWISALEQNICAGRVCGTCGYDLRGQTSARCPECGEVSAALERLIAHWPEDAAKRRAELAAMAKP